MLGNAVLGMDSCFDPYSRNGMNLLSNVRTFRSQSPRGVISLVRGKGLLILRLRRISTIVLSIACFSPEHISCFKVVIFL